MTIFVWRHPKPIGATGRCIGRTDLPVEQRKAKRLAHRIRSLARRRQLPRRVVTSGLRRSRAVGRVLAGWGWRHEVDRRLDEFDFGAWEGCAWSAIGEEAFAAWEADFASHRPGDGENVGELVARCRQCLDQWSTQSSGVCVVGHAGWISAATWWRRSGAATALAPEGLAPVPVAAEWPASLRYGECVVF